MGTIDEQELLRLMEKFHDQVIEFGDKFAEAVKPLDKAIEAAKNSEKKFWVVHKTAVASAIILVTLLVVVIGIGITMRFTNLCVVHVSGDKTTADISSCKR